MVNEKVIRVLGRSAQLFRGDLDKYGQELQSIIQSARLLVVGGAGSIGRSVVKEVFARNPRALHVVDLSENNLTELVRDIRSSMGYISGDFRTYCLDCGSSEFEAFFQAEGPYDFLLNLSALKHVRSERDPYTLMRMVRVNIINCERMLSRAISNNLSKYFCVSTDKAANPVNMMGASKRIMEMFLMRASRSIPVSSARFANVAFSEGSLLDGFNHRMRKMQPLSAPSDVKRYFVTEQEAGVLCLLAAILGQNRDIFFPKLGSELVATSFSEIAVRYLEDLGYAPYLCDSEDEARAKARELSAKKQWPCYFFESDTTGEKDLEEFYTDGERVNWDLFQDIGIIKNDVGYNEDRLEFFLKSIDGLLKRGRWTKKELVDLFNSMLSNFSHNETFKYLDGRM